MSKTIEELSTEIALLTEAIKGLNVKENYTQPMAKDLTKYEFFTGLVLVGLLNNTNVDQNTDRDTLIQKAKNIAYLLTIWK